jgi:chorismate dehydratase
LKFPMPRPRISAISFLNTAPLMWDFEHGDAGQRFEISYTIPSMCAHAVAGGSADIGLVPAVVYLDIPDLVVIPDIAIAARGPVRSIVLVSRVPLEKIGSVGADIASRTSVALCRLLLKKWQREGLPEPQFTPMEADLQPMLARCDAALLIGDSALRVKRKEYPVVLDLAEEWVRFTGKPFVFAFWAVRAAAARPEFVRVFQQSRDRGLQPESITALAREWAPRVGISETDVRSYLTKNICYSLDAENLAGLQLFWQMATAEGILPAPKSLRFLSAGVLQPAEAAARG